MKEKTKEWLKAGGVGVAAGVSGTAGAKELYDWINKEKDSDVTPEKETNSGGGTHESQNIDDIDSDIIETHPDTQPVNHPHDDVNEIVPVDSGGGSSEILAENTGSEEVVVIDVDPNEVAMELVSEDENISDEYLAYHSGPETVDIEEIIDGGQLGELEEVFEEDVTALAEDEESDEDEDLDDDLAANDDDIEDADDMADMVDDIG